MNKLEKVAGTYAEVAARERIPHAVADYLSAQNLPQRLVLAPHPLLDNLAWPDGWQVERRRALGDDRVSLAVAFCAIAETGSLMLLAGPDSPTTLNFLPDDFLCVLPENRIVPRMEDAWALLRSERGCMPRAANIITGPSRTADVEQTIQLGAHGPRSLHVLLPGEGCNSTAKADLAANSAIESRLEALLRQGLPAASAPMGKSRFHAGRRREEQGCDWREEQQKTRCGHAWQNRFRPIPVDAAQDV